MKKTCAKLPRNYDIFQTAFHSYSTDFEQVVFGVVFRIFARQVCIISLFHYFMGFVHKSVIFKSLEVAQELILRLF